MTDQAPQPPKPTKLSMAEKAFLVDLSQVVLRFSSGHRIDRHHLARLLRRAAAAIERGFSGDVTAGDVTEDLAP